MSKGDDPRPMDGDKFRSEYERIFRKDPVQKMLAGIVKGYMVNCCCGHRYYATNTPIRCIVCQTMFVEIKNDK